MELLWNDLRFALRTLARNPAFTAVVLVTLALGIGANSAIYGLMDQVLLRPLPVHRPERLVLLEGPGIWSGRSSSQYNSITPMSQPMFEGLRDRTPAFSGALAQWLSEVHFRATTPSTENVTAGLVSGSFFAVLGLQPAHGRLFTADDDRTPGAHPLVVVSHRFFEGRLAGDRSVLGRTVHVNGHPMTVIGVAPAGFHGIDVGNSVDIYVPLAMQKEVLPTWPASRGDWRTRWLTVMARLQDGVTLEQATAAANVVYAQLLKEDAQTLTTTSEKNRALFLQKKLELEPGGRGISGLRELAASPLLALMGMVGLVLLIACANVANLLLARGSSRQKEMAVRLALGAGRGRLVRQLMMESLVLSIAGGALGLLLAGWLGRVLLAALPFEEAARSLSSEPDLRIALFTLGVSLLTGLLFGLAPAVHSTRLPIAPTLKNEAGAVLGGTKPFRFRKGLVVAQITLSLLLLVGAGLFTRSLMNLRALDPGFQPDRLVTFTVDPSLGGYDAGRSRLLLERLREELSAEPGVRSVSLAAVPLMANSDESSTIIVEGYQQKEDEDMNPGFNAVGSDFFTTLGIPMVRGRDFGPGDALGAPKVAVVNETFARYFFGKEDPIGRRFGRKRDAKADTEIIGVVRDGKAGSLREQTKRFVYVPYTQRNDLGSMTFYVRSGAEAEMLLARAPAVVRRVEPTLPVTELRTMRAQIAESLFADRLVAALSATFGLLATVLAALGLYGVMAYAVSQRTREIGIRMALGAQRSNVLGMVLRDVAVLVGAGIVLGLPGGYGLGRVLQSQLYGLQALDPTTFGIATATLLVTALVAGYIPARRAVRVDPMVALRYE
jgi:predicted permease